MMPYSVDLAIDYLLGTTGDKKKKTFSTKIQIIVPGSVAFTVGLKMSMISIPMSVIGVFQSLIRFP